MQEKYTRENNVKYLVFEIEGYIQENYQIKMIKENKIECLLELDIRYINNNTAYYYNITSRQPISKIYEGNNMTWKDVESICISIANMQKQIERYMLSSDYIMLDENYLYMDLTDRKLYFVYCLQNEGSFDNSLRKLFEYILEHFNHSNKKEVMKVYEVYQKILQGNGSLDEIIKEIVVDSFAKECEISETFQGSDSVYEVPSVLKESVVKEQEELSVGFVYIKRGIQTILISGILVLSWGIIMPQLKIINIQYYPSIIGIGITAIILTKATACFKKLEGKYTRIKPYQQEVAYKIFGHEVEREIKDELKNELKSELKSDIKSEAKSDVKKNITNYKKGSEPERQTMLLSEFVEEVEERSLRFFLKSNEKNKNQDIIYLDEFPCVIGSSSEYCNKVIENDRISRMHIRFLKCEEGIMVEDLNSTNGTYVNGERLEHFAPRTLISEDILKIADVSYIFHIDFI